MVERTALSLKTRTHSRTSEVYCEANPLNRYVTSVPNAMSFCPLCDKYVSLKHGNVCFSNLDSDLKDNW